MNNVNLSLKVSNDSESIKAVRQISDKLTVVNTYLYAGKNEDGTYKKSVNFEVKVTAKTQCLGVNLEPGAKIDVEGFFTTDNFQDREGKTRAKLVLVAKKITPTPAFEQSEQNQNSAAPAAPAASAAPAKDDFVPMPENGEEELPWQ